MISFTEALAQLLGTVIPVGRERLALDAAAGRVLAEDVIAAAPMPPFDYSAMDGYAVRAADFAPSGPTTLLVRGESAAGGSAPRLEAGTACRIYTGAELPALADAIVIQEDAVRGGDAITVAAAPEVGHWIRRRGEDLAAGAVALPRGARMTPGRLALAASLDRPSLVVARAPVVTILGSGDELRAPGDPPRPGSICESNATFIAATARGLGAIVRVAPFVPDHPDRTREAVESALRGSDLLVTIGGVSVGDRDYLRPALVAAGVALDFYKVAIKPGKPIVVGRAGVAHVLGLPGNPASASLTFLLFGAPLLRALQGDAAPVPVRLRARTIGELSRRPGREEFLRVQLDVTGSQLRARIRPNQASGAVTSFAEADALAVVPADRERVNDGDELEIIRISDV